MHKVGKNLSLTYDCPSWVSGQRTVRLNAFGRVVDLAIRATVGLDPRIVSTAVGQFTRSKPIQHHDR